jgi:hypothetical protein
LIKKKGSITFFLVDLVEVYGTEHNFHWGHVFVDCKRKTTVWNTFFCFMVVSDKH